MRTHGLRSVFALAGIAAIVLIFAPESAAQRRVDPKFTYQRVIAVVPFVGQGTASDPRRPQYAPWPPSQGRKNIGALCARGNSRLDDLYL